MKSFALVRLDDVKKHVVVREDFVYDLNQEKLKNYGVNRNQKYRVFWSNDEKCQTANFNANLSSVHPPIENEACYNATLYRFYCKFYFVLLFIFQIIRKHS